MKFLQSNSDIHLIVRGILVWQDKLVLCRIKNSDHFFLPGGHIENGETAQSALERELVEELGDFDYQIDDWIGLCENIFEIKTGLLQHELNLVFGVTLPQNFRLQTKEEHLDFVLVPKQNLDQYNLLPISLKTHLIKYLKTAQTFVI